MTTLVYLIPVALFLGGISLAAFLWALRNGQYDDLDGAAARILLDTPTGSDDVGETAGERTPPSRHHGDRPPM